MSIVYLKHSEIDKKRWDNCVQQSVNTTIYCYSWYLDTVCKGWDALVDDNYRTIMPLTHGKKWGINYLYQPFFTQQLGIFSVDILSTEVTNIFLDAIPNHYKFIEIKLNVFNKIENEKFKQIANKTYVLDLISGYPMISNNYSSNAKRNIKKAKGNNLKIIQNVDPDTIIDLFINNRGKNIDKLGIEEYKIVRKIILNAFSHQKAESWGIVTSDNKLCAGACFLKSDGKVYFLFSATNDEARQNGAMFWLLDRFIFQNSEQNLSLNFNGSNDENIARFYAGFGAKESTYYRIRRNLLPWPLSLFKTTN